MKDESWIYDHDEPLTRYSLGQEGSHPLVCIGVNPSTAVPGNLDPTVAGVARFAKAKGYDGWLMFNLYPQRATNPNTMHKRFQSKIHQKNYGCHQEISRSTIIRCVVRLGNLDRKTSLSLTLFAGSISHS